MNPYEVLEVTPDDEQGTIRDAYRRLVRLHHPDLALNQERRDLSHAQMQRINQAWQIVGDPEKRAKFDAGQAEAEARKEAARLEAARRNLRSARPQANKVRHAANSRSSPSKSAARKSSASKAGKTTLNKSTAGISPTRQKVKTLKKARSPEEIAARNLQKLAEASHFWREGRSADAIASCQSVLRNDFRNVAAREILGDIYLGLGEKTRALVLFEQALVLQKGNANLKRKIAKIRSQAIADGILKEEPIVRMKFKNETIPVSPVAKPNSAEPIHDGNFWRRLRDKLGNRR